MKAVMVYIKRHRCSCPALNLSLLRSNQEQQQWGSTTIFLNCKTVRKMNVNMTPNPLKTFSQVLDS